MKGILNQSIPRTLLTLVSKGTLNFQATSVHRLSGIAQPQKQAMPAPSPGPVLHRTTQI